MTFYLIFLWNVNYMAKEARRMIVSCSSTDLRSIPKRLIKLSTPSSLPNVIFIKQSASASTFADDLE